MKYLLTIELDLKQHLFDLSQLRSIQTLLPLSRFVHHRHQSMAPTKVLPPLWGPDTTNPHGATRTTVVLLSIILGLFSATVFFIITLVMHKLYNAGAVPKALPTLCKYNLAKTLEAGNMIVQLSGILKKSSRSKHGFQSFEMSYEHSLHQSDPQVSETKFSETGSIGAGSDLLPGVRGYTTRRIHKRSSMSEQTELKTYDSQYTDTGYTYSAHGISRTAGIQALKRTQTS